MLTLLLLISNIFSTFKEENQTESISTRNRFECLSDFSDDHPEKKTQKNVRFEKEPVIYEIPERGDSQEELPKEKEKKFMCGDMKVDILICVTIIVCVSFLGVLLFLKIFTTVI